MVTVRLFFLTCHRHCLFIHLFSLIVYRFPWYKYSVDENIAWWHTNRLVWKSTHCQDDQSMEGGGGTCVLFVWKSAFNCRKIGIPCVESLRIVNCSHGKCWLTFEWLLGLTWSGTYILSIVYIVWTSLTYLWPILPVFLCFVLFFFSRNISYYNNLWFKKSYYFNNLFVTKLLENISI